MFRKSSKVVIKKTYTKTLKKKTTLQRKRQKTTLRTRKLYYIKVVKKKYDKFKLHLRVKNTKKVKCFPRKLEK